MTVWMLLLGSILFFLIGVGIGKYLTHRGINLDFTIENTRHQHNILWALGIFTAVVLILLFTDNNNLPNIFTFVFPEIILLYLGEYFYDVLIIFVCLIIGLLVALELFGQGNKNTKIQLLVGLVIIIFGLSYLVDQTLPITKYLKAEKIVNEYVVLQTTNYTCAPATIATLGRFTKKHPNLTEKQVVKLARTDKIGTSTLKEIKTLEKLDFDPKYLKHLETSDLIKINKPAILHVKEEYQNRVVAHAVALLGINPKKQQILIANPLYGLQIISFQDIKSYWNGEAIFINNIT